MKSVVNYPILFFNKFDTMEKFKSYFKNERAILFFAWLLIVILTLTQRLIAGVFDFNQFNLSDILKFPFSVLLIGTILLFIWVVPGFKFIIAIKANWKYLLFLIHSLVYSFAYLFFVIILYGTLIEQLNINWIRGQVKDVFANGFHTILQNYIFLISILFAFNYFKSREQTNLAKNKIENELLKVKHNALKAKLQPHFLFNTLNSIVALIEENKNKAQKSLINLSDLLRYSMDIKPKKLISINEEIDLLKKYLSIEKSRYEDQIDVEWVFTELKGKNEKFEVPAMILQPIVENSIKHGFKNIDYKLKLVIEINLINKSVRIKNNGQSLLKKLRTNTGLQLVKQRLEYHFEDNAQFKIYQKDNWVINDINFT